MVGKEKQDIRAFLKYRTGEVYNLCPSCGKGLINRHKAHMDDINAYLSLGE